MSSTSSFKRNLIAAALPFLLLSGCGGDGNNDAQPIPEDDTTPPSASIVFPPANSLTDGIGIRVRGTAADDRLVSAVRVNGVSASTTDDYANWEVSIGLAYGSNEIVVEVVDAAGNTNNDAAQVIVQRELLLFSPTALAYDAASNRVFISDNTLDALVSIDLASGQRSFFLNDDSFFDPRSLIMDADNNRLLVLDSILGEIFSVDLDSADPVILSANDAGDSIVAAMDFMLDLANERALTISPSAELAVEIDLETGEREVLWREADDDDDDDDEEAEIPELGIIGSMTYDANNNRIVASNFLPEENQSSLMVLDMEEREWRWLSENTRPDDAMPLGRIEDLQLDETNQRLLAADHKNKTLVAFDITSGERSIISDGSTANSPLPFGPQSLALDLDNSRLLVLDADRQAVVTVSLNDGSRTIISDLSFPNDNATLISPYELALNLSSRQAFVIDNEDDALIAIELDSGERRIVSQTDATLPLTQAEDIALDNTNDRALVIDSEQRALLAIDLAGGQRTLISNNDRHPANPFDSPQALVLDTDNNRALVVDGGVDRIFAVDLSTGQRNVISEADAELDFSHVGDIVLDTARDRLLLTDTENPGVYAVDLTSGQRSRFSSSGLPNNANAISRPTDLVLDLQNNRLLLTDEGIDGVIAVSLDNGARTLVSGNDTNTTPFVSPKALALDAENGHAYVIDRSFGALYLVDLHSGQRMLRSF